MDEDKLTQALLQYRNTPSRRRSVPCSKAIRTSYSGHIASPQEGVSIRMAALSGRSRATSHYHSREVEHSYNEHAHSLPLITIGSHVAVQNHETKQWDIYGTITDIGPHRRYFIKTCGGNVLVRNRRFIRRRVPLVPTRSTLPPSPSTTPQILTTPH